LFNWPNSLHVAIGIGGSGLGNMRHNNGGSLVQKRPIDLARPIRIGTVDLHNVTEIEEQILQTIQKHTN
jgi:hypothetical protein